MDDDEYLECDCDDCCGVSANIGFQGHAGPDGIQINGPQGYIGPSYVAPSGQRGSQGAPNDCRADVWRGVQGERGPQGITVDGFQGDVGYQGLTVRGAQGSDGHQGFFGRQGVSLSGPQGFASILVSGTQGPQGNTGAIGKSVVGRQGVAGLTTVNANVTPFSTQTWTSSINGTIGSWTPPTSVPFGSTLFLNVSFSISVSPANSGLKFQILQGGSTVLFTRDVASLPFGGIVTTSRFPFSFDTFAILTPGPFSFKWSSALAPLDVAIYDFSAVCLQIS